MLSRRFYVPMILSVVSGPLTGCDPNALVVGPGNEGSSSPINGDASGSGGTPEPSNNALPDFSLPDVNANSPRYQEAVSPRDYLGQISAWYFGHAT